ncbi:MAG: hypothetical protein ACI9M9_001352 [Flavobacteriaceae bacterium]
MFAGSLFAQHNIIIDATLQTDTRSLVIEQQVEFVNTSNDVLNEIYFNDWANSFSSKNTELGKRFSDNYNSSFHFEKDRNRGKSDILSVTSEAEIPLEWIRGEAVDILKVKLNKPLPPGESYTLIFNYTVKQPNDKFTRYGISKTNDYKLRYWYLSPAVYDGEWLAYSNKNLDDLYTLPSDFKISIHIPENYHLISDLNKVFEGAYEGVKTTILEGKNRISADLYLEQFLSFETIETDKVDIVTNSVDSKIRGSIRALIIDRITHFLDYNLGTYPFNKLVISEADYRSNPVYGLNQLPDFISPFPDGFEYDMEEFKTITRNYIQNTLQLHPRNDYWLAQALQIHLMISYVNKFYPNMKMIGSLSDFWVVRWAHIADLEFNDQYSMLYLNMARNNINQKLTTPRDSLMRFNNNIANPYYGGQGMTYLSEYIGKEALSKSIRQFYSENRLKPVQSNDFKRNLKQNTTLPVDWFFEDYSNSETTIDYKINKVKKRGDSLEVQIKNLRNNSLPVSLYGINKTDIIFKKWINPVADTTSVMVSSANIKSLALNYNGEIPEYNRRNNYKSLKGLLNKPIQLRLFQDIEDPRYNQIFFMPIFQYNLYDGVSVGMRLYNKTVLRKALVYSLEPQIGLRSKNIVGSAKISYMQNIQSSNLYTIRYGASGNYFSYDRDLFYKRFTPFLTFAFRNPDLRNNEKQYINIRNVNVQRDDDPSDIYQEPDYSVFNIQYVYTNPNLINYFKGTFDYQISSKFSKIFANIEYRKLFNNNRQLNLRLFAGTFIYNDSRSNDNFFSFALDRPTDYLFDYGYYGRSEEQGLFSQQYIVAEGGFKSQLEPAFSNTWMATINASTNIWRWIQVYGDVGLVNNKTNGTKAVYDAGIRINLVTDYFELYFPVYSNLGFEPNLPNYDEKIRFIVTLSPKTLLKLFTRKWY